MAEPQITEISAYFATHLPADGASPAAATQGWRRAIRLAREVGQVGWLTALVTRHAPDDPVLRAHCDALAR